MGLKRQILLAASRRKNDYPGLSASNAEQILAQFSLTDDSAPLYQGPGTSVAAPGAAASPGRTFFRFAMIEEALAFSGQAAINLTNLLPANAVVVAASMNFDTNVVLATAVKVGLGIAGTPSQLLLSTTTVAKNTKTDAGLAGQVYTAAQQLAIAACATGGTAAGTITSGTVRVRVIYRYVPSLPDAA